MRKQVLELTSSEGSKQIFHFSEVGCILPCQLWWASNIKHTHYPVPRYPTLSILRSASSHPSSSLSPFLPLSLSSSIPPSLPSLSLSVLASHLATLCNSLCVKPVERFAFGWNINLSLGQRVGQLTVAWLPESNLSYEMGSLNLSLPLIFNLFQCLAFKWTGECQKMPCAVISKQQEYGLRIRRLLVRFPAVPNDDVSLGKALHPTCHRGECPCRECPCTYCKSLWIRASA